MTFLEYLQSIYPGIFGPHGLSAHGLAGGERRDMMQSGRTDFRGGINLPDPRGPVLDTMPINPGIGRRPPIGNGPVIGTMPIAPGPGNRRDMGGPRLDLMPIPHASDRARQVANGMPFRTDGIDRVAPGQRRGTY